jgi:hypothetical protein
MFSSFRSKVKEPADPPPKEAVKSRGLEVIEDDPDTAWSLWDSALAEQDSRFSTGGPESVPFGVDIQQGVNFSQATEPMALADAEPTQPVKLEDKSSLQRKEEALAVVDLFHHRIANTIRSIWGYKECSVYIYKLIMNGGDGMGHARVGFNQDAVEAMLVLAQLHDAEFGAVPTETGFAGLDKAR